MSGNNTGNASSPGMDEGKFEALSGIGFTGRSDRECATDIVIAMIGANMLTIDKVAGAFVSIAKAIRESDAPAEPEAPAETIEKPTAAQIKKSITPDALISFLDGKSYKTLKRHLGTHGLDPYRYRERYGLPNDYPMVAPNYAAQRSTLAKQIGLGVPAANRKAAAAG